MKAYRKFKLPEAARPPAKVANPAKVRTPEPEALATLATLAAGKTAPEPDDVEVEERKAMANGGRAGSLSRRPGAPPSPEADAGFRRAMASSNQ